MINIDISNELDLEQKLLKLRPQTIFNLSAYGAYERQNEINQIHKVNFLGTLTLIRKLQNIGCDSYVHAGSSSEYGLNCSGPGEADQLVPNSHYAVSKAAASLLISYYGKIEAFPCCNLRLYSIYGPYEERDRLIPKIIENGLSGNYPSLVNKDISRDFVYIDDCTRAFVRAALTACKTDPGISINIGSGKQTTLEDVANATKNIFNIQLAPKFGSRPNRKWDLTNWFSNPSLAKTIMNWSSRISFFDGLILTKNWELIARTQLNYAPPPKITKKITAIIACYKDHEAIPIMHKRLTDVFNKIGSDYEIIFVNDRSPTNDEDVIKEICKIDYHTVGVSHARNFGSQAAFLSGMNIATGDAVVLLDGDLQDPPEVIEHFYHKWQEGFDVVYGVRVKREAALYMQLFYKLFYRVFKNLSDVEIPVDAGDFSLIDRKVFEHIIKMPEKDVFLRGLRAWVGFKQTGIPYIRPERMFGRSTNNFLKNIWWAKKAIFSFSFKPLSYIQFFGVLLFFITTLMTFIYIVLYYLNPNASSPGITTIIVLTLGLGSINLLSISILGDYLGKVLEEVKNRPRFIRSKIIKGSTSLETQAQIDQYILKTRGIENG